jgi:bifunctional non-homologous end joining protein LigD
VRERQTRLHAGSARLQPAAATRGPGVESGASGVSMRRDLNMASRLTRHSETRSREAVTSTDASSGDESLMSRAKHASARKAVHVSSARAKGASSLHVADAGTGSALTLIDQLHAIESSRRDGVLVLPDGDRLSVSNLHKVFWPKQKFTKGDLFRYYAEVAPCLLPAVADRPLVMKRFPNGVAGAPFYQHRAENVPDGVRVENVTVADRRPQIIGGNLKTLLYTTQLAAISQDPWFSRVMSPHDADHVALDLDPPPSVPFERVLDVARWIRDELDLLGALGVPKTSGADGLHIYLPLAAGTPYEAGRLFCEIIATVVAQKHPRFATIERSVSARGARVYIDFLQNILGKTLAAAYSARASTWAGVSTPLTWEEVDRGVRREEFTLKTMTRRINSVGDLWAALRKSKGVDLSRVEQYASRTGRRPVKRRSSS